MAEILLYGGIDTYSAENFIREMEANKGNEVCIRTFSPGGSVFANYGMIAKCLEHKPSKPSMKVDGRADSIVAIMMCALDDVECLDISKFIFHRATVGEYIESRPELFTDEVRATLISVNQTLRGFIEGKCTASEWKKVTGVELDKMFSLDSRIDVEINAKQAQKLGFVKNVIAITPKKKKEILALSASMGIAASSLSHLNITSNNNNDMEINSLADLKAQFPAIYEAAVKHGQAQERDRVGAFMAFNSYAPKEVAAGIASGELPTETFKAEMTVKIIEAKVANQGIANVTAATTAAIPTGENAPADPTAAAAATEAQKMLDEAEKIANARVAGITNLV